MGKIVRLDLHLPPTGTGIADGGEFYIRRPELRLEFDKDKY